MYPHCSFLTAWRADLKMRNYSRFLTIFRLNAASSIKVNPQLLYLNRKIWELWLFLSPLDQSTSQLSKGSCGYSVLRCCVIRRCIQTGDHCSPFGSFHLYVGKDTCIARAKEPEKPFPSGPSISFFQIPLPDLEIFNTFQFFSRNVDVTSFYCELLKEMEKLVLDSRKV